MWGLLNRKKQLAAEQGIESHFGQAAVSVGSRDSVGNVSVCSSDFVSDASSQNENYTKGLENEVAVMAQKIARLNMEAAAMRQFYAGKDKVIEQQRILIERLQHNMSDDEFSDDSDSDSDEE